MELCLKRKIPLLVLAICIVFSVVFAENSAAGEIDHDCIGENCPVCLHIETARSFLKALKIADTFSSLNSHLVFTANIPKNNAECNIYPHSPIVLKVRFNS
jgi:hypothetical protein